MVLRLSQNLFWLSGDEKIGSSPWHMRTPRPRTCPMQVCGYSMTADISLCLSIRQLSMTCCLDSWPTRSSSHLVVPLNGQDLTVPILEQPSVLSSGNSHST